MLSTPAASAQSAPPCACPVAYLNAYNSEPFQYSVLLLSNQPVPFDSVYLPPVGITSQVFDPSSFTLLSAGAYRVTYTLGLNNVSASFAVRLNGTTVPFTGLDLADGQMLTRVVLVTAQAGDVLQIANVGPGVAALGSTGSATPCATLLIELVA